MNAPRLALGPFELVDRLGEGGFATVWRGRHADGTPVAIKCVTPGRPAAELLRHEARCAARLLHPSIVTVYDFGTVGAEAALASDGALVAGSPYLVMELARDGSLALGLRESTWPELRRVLRALASALAHAHARGVIHRDIKPANVLVDGERVLLGDFGISAMLRGDRPAGAGGTPAYMAPEQIVGRYEDQGPATDLYALGCLVHFLATGQPPFSGQDREAVLRAHCRTPPPPLVPRFAVPRGLERLVDRLLEKHPAERPAHAAEVLRALDALDESALRPGAGELGAPAIDAPSTVDVGDVVAEEAVGPARSCAPPRLSTAADWRVLGEPAAVRAPLGAGLGLFGLRPLPLIGREEQRDRLWRATAAAGGPRAVVVRGGAGHGKSRLAEWLADAAAELGVATVVRATLSGRPHGIVAALRAHLGCDDLTGDDLRERLQATLPRAPRATLERFAHLLVPAEAHERALERLDEWLAAVSEVIAALAALGPLVLVLDDAHASARAVALASHLIAGERALPVVVVLIAQDEALLASPERALAFDRLERMTGAERVEVPLLDDEQTARVLESLLHLAPQLAAQARARAAGNPLFAVQLVADWVHRGALAPGPDGFDLASEAPPQLPDDIHELWTRRLDALTQAFEPHQRAALAEALEVAAAWGPEVELDVFGLACARAGAESDRVLDVLVRMRLAVLEPACFRFAHGLLRESVERRARERGRWRAAHAACAALLRRLPRVLHSGSSERLGIHLHEAADHAGALEPLLSGARERMLSGELAPAASLLARREHALEALGADSQDPRRVEGRVLHAEIYARRGDLEEAERSLEGAEEGSDARALADAARVRGMVAHKRGERGAHEHFRRALRHYEALGDRYHVAESLYGIAESSKLTGELDEADRAYRAAADIFAALGVEGALGRTMSGRADALRRLGRHDEAVALLHDALAHLERTGPRHVVGIAHNVLGDLARGRGDHASAGAHYEAARAILHELRSPDESIVELNLGLSLLAREYWDDARARLEAVRARFEREGRAHFVSYPVAGLAACAAAADDPDELRAQLAEVERMFARQAIADPDLEWCLRRTAELAQRAGHNASAALARALARRAGG